MHSIRVEVFPAASGECILISFHGKKLTNILIDSGYVSTYNSFLRKRLITMSQNGECIDLFVITHIDSDHISGAIRLLSENGKSNYSKIIKIKEIWHNSYRHLQIWENCTKTTEIERDILKKIISENYIRNYGQISCREGKISAFQGSSLASLIYEGQYNWNSSFNGKSVCRDNKNNITINKEVNIILLSPTQEKLNELRLLWLKELNKLRYNFNISSEDIFDDAFEFFMLSKNDPRIKSCSNFISYSNLKFQSSLKDTFHEDDSVVNGSSIAFIIEFQGRKLLLLGDSHPSVIVKSLKEQRKVLNYMYYDLIKVSHHGSKANTNIDLLKLIDSPKYVISTDGRKHGHPSIETIYEIVSRESMMQRELIFNYNHKIYSFLTNRGFMKTYNYTLKECINEIPLVIDL